MIGIDAIVAVLKRYREPWASHLVPKIEREAIAEAITILGRVKRLEFLLEREGAPWDPDNSYLAGEHEAFMTVKRFMATGEEW